MLWEAARHCLQLLGLTPPQARLTSAFLLSPFVTRADVINSVPRATALQGKQVAVTGAYILVTKHFWHSGSFVWRERESFLPFLLCEAFWCLVHAPPCVPVDSP